MSALPKNDLVGSVLRATAILEAIAACPPGLTPKAVSVQLGLNLSTCYHLINTLAVTGLLERRADNQAYVLGSKIPYLNSAFLQRIQVVPLLMAQLQALHDSTGETAYLAQWQDGDAVIIAIMEGVQPVRVQSLYVGYRGNAHASALGKALLSSLPPNELESYLARQPFPACTPYTITSGAALRAHLAEVRAAGYSVDIEEFAVELCCIGAPVYDRDGLRAAIAISVPRSRYDRAHDHFVETVCRVARRASGVLGHR